MRGEKVFVVFALILFLLSGITFGKSISEESAITKDLLNEAERAINEMQERDIPTIRVNETFQEALQIYEGQELLESSGRRANFEIVIELCNKILEIKEASFLAKDELNVFIETYKEYEKNLDLSEMDEEYQKIISSFEEERFEETPALISKGYEKISELQSSQTTVKLFYKSTSQSIERFFTNYWLHLLISIVSLIVLFIFFKRSITLFIIRKKIRNLEFQKKNLNYLIKKSQKQYFANRSMSGLEYNIKIQKFEDMIRDINREIPLLKEEIAKIKGGKNIHYKDSKESKKVIKKSDKIKKKSEKIINKEKEKIRELEEARSLEIPKPLSEKNQKKKSSEKNSQKKIKNKISKKINKNKVKNQLKKIKILRKLAKKVLKIKSKSEIGHLLSFAVIRPNVLVFN